MKNNAQAGFKGTTNLAIMNPLPPSLDLCAEAFAFYGPICGHKAAADLRNWVPLRISGLWVAGSGCRFLLSMPTNPTYETRAPMRAWQFLLLVVAYFSILVLTQSLSLSFLVGFVLASVFCFHYLSEKLKTRPELSQKIVAVAGYALVVFIVFACVSAVADPLLCQGQSTIGLHLLSEKTCSAVVGGFDGYLHEFNHY